MLAGLFDKTFNWLEKSLNLRLNQHQLLAGNLANGETPGYRAKHVDFQATIMAIMGRSEGGILRRTHPGHLGGGESASGIPLRLISASGPARADGNSVDMDTEMVRLAENGLLYNATVQALARKLAILKQSVEGVR